MSKVKVKYTSPIKWVESSYHLSDTGEKIVNLTANNIVASCGVTYRNKSWEAHIIFDEYHDERTRTFSLKKRQLAIDWVQEQFDEELQEVLATRKVKET